MKRATSWGSQFLNAFLISIHALVKRATQAVHSEVAPDIDFNPRPREEGDIIHPKILFVFKISIHALVKRATGWSAAVKRTTA